MDEKKMIWGGWKSIVLSKIIVVVFGAILFLVDLRALWIIRYMLTLSPPGVFPDIAVELLMVYLYVCSIPAYVVLFQLFMLLSRITKGDVFTRRNIVCFRLVSWCCLMVGIFSIPFIAVWPSLGLVCLAAGLVGLILRIVKNVFQQAVNMKEELELTV